MTGKDQRLSDALGVVPLPTSSDADVPRPEARAGPAGQARAGPHLALPHLPDWGRASERAIIRITNQNLAVSQLRR